MPQNILELEEYQDCLFAEENCFFLHREREAESKFIRSVGATVKSWSERGLMLVAKGLVAVHFPISSSSSLPHGVFE